jgi:hypothetical protein
MNKSEALKRLDALETEAAALRKIIEAQEPVEKKPLLWQGLSHVAIRGIGAVQSLTVAQAYAEAFNTMLDLRRQPGGEAAVDEKCQWSIRGDGSIGSFNRLWVKIEMICPMFDSEASALAARKAVGWDRIEKMMNTLHGRGYD